MQTVNQTVAMTQGGSAFAEPINMRKRIGSTVYEVRIHFNQDAKETVEEKILRLMKNDLHLSAEPVKMELPQIGRLSERSSA